jgi:hypothetical protein
MPLLDSPQAPQAIEEDRVLYSELTGLLTGLKNTWGVCYGACINDVELLG